MAIAWEFTITPIDVPKRIVRVVAVRMDSALPGLVYIVSLENADISTVAKKTAALNVLWAKYQQKLAYQQLLNSIAGEITTLEAQGKTDFEGREI